MNQKHGIPRIGDGTPFSLRRGSFLDGTQQVYFMAGQQPGNTAEDRGWGYAPPTDWPAAGTLLRVPQVVWLSCCYQRVTDALAASASFDATVGLSSYQSSSPDTPGYHVYALADGTVYTFTSDNPTPAYLQAPALSSTEVYNETLPNIHADEYTRVLALLQDVRERIAALRPGRTWVALWDYCHESFETDFPDSVFNGPSVSCLLAPDPDEVFFGTDFLHINVGTFVTYHNLPTIGTHAYALDDTVCGPELDAIRASYPKFRNYATWLYSPVGEFGEFPDGPDAPSLPSVPATYTVIDGTDSYTFDIERTPAVGLEITRYTTFDAGITATNASLAGTNQSYRDQYAAVASLMSDYGFVDQGDSDSLTAGWLVEQIADHFGFDPTTGADLV